MHPFNTSHAVHRSAHSYIYNHEPHASPATPFHRLVLLASAISMYPPLVSRFPHLNLLPPLSDYQSGLCFCILWTFSLCRLSCPCFTCSSLSTYLFIYRAVSFGGCPFPPFTVLTILVHCAPTSHPYSCVSCKVFLSLFIRPLFPFVPRYFTFITGYPNECIMTILLIFLSRHRFFTLGHALACCCLVAIIFYTLRAL